MNKRFKKTLKTIFVFTLIFSWVFSGWPRIWQNPLLPPKIQKAHAAVAYQGSSLVAAASTGADVTPGLPTHQADDIFLLQVLVRDVDDTLTVTDWTQITTIDDGTAGRHWWYWKRATSDSETAPLVDKSTTSGDTYATVTSYRGAVTSGDPWEATSAAICTGTADPFDLNEITTLTDGSLVVASWNDRDNAVNSTTYSLTSPSSLTSNMHLKSAVGGDGLNSSGSAVKIAAGATGAVSVSPSKTPDGACGLVLALKPVLLLSTSIEIRAQNYTTLVSNITFPVGDPSVVISNPANETETQVFGDAGTAKPVVTLVNTAAVAYNIWYNITAFSDGVVSSENYIIIAKGGACANADAITESATLDGSNYVTSGTVITIAATGDGGEADERDLYLKITLSSLAGKSGTSTLTILGEAL